MLIIGQQVFIKKILTTPPKQRHLQLLNTEKVQSSSFFHMQDNEMCTIQKAPTILKLSGWLCWASPKQKMPTYDQNIQHVFCNTPLHPTHIFRVFRLIFSFVTRVVITIICWSWWCCPFIFWQRVLPDEKKERNAVWNAKTGDNSPWYKSNS